MASGHFGDVGWDPSLPPQLFINVESTFVPGKTVSNLSGQRSQLQNVFRVTVPSISSPVVIQTSGGTGDADLVVYTATTWGQSFKYGSALQEVRQPGNVGQVVLTPGDEYYVMLRGFSNYSGVTLEARTIDVIPLSEGMEYTGLSGSYWSEKLFRIDVPAGMQQLSIQSQRGTGDADLFLRPGIAPTRDRFDHASQEATSNETITVQTPAAGAWYLLVHGYTAYSGVSLKASFIRQLDLRSLAARSDADYPDHVGNDYNGLGTSGAQDVGYAVLAPVGGEITYAGAYAPDDNGASAYGELLVAISKQVYRQDGLHNYREDGTYRLLGPGEVTVFVGHMTRERYLPSGEIDPLAPVINLTPGTYVSAGQVIGYVAPLSRAGSATQPHVHVGILPYRENGQGAAKFETATGRLTHFPGRWDLVDDRESPDSDFDSYAAYVRATLIAPPGSSRWDYLY